MKGGRTAGQLFTVLYQQNWTDERGELSLPICKQRDKTNHAQHLPANCLATETNCFTFTLTNYTTLTYR